MTDDQAQGEGARTDFFISYTSKDQPWAEWIAMQLEMGRRKQARIDLWAGFSAAAKSPGTTAAIPTHGPREYP